ncbi:carbohydrate-binding module family 13 protein [Phellopilus nigrolimitatus]|nr:carbohydrate-binding module family 13 protein [Phellopilus nigrolimitatus]
MFSAKLLLLALCAAAARAQTPSYLSPVLLEPGNDAGMCLTAAADTNGANVPILPCTGGDSQKWTFDGGRVTLYGGSKCLDVAGGANADGTKLQIWDCTANDANQQFYYTSDFRLSWTNMGKCVDLPGGSLSSGNQAQIWTCGAGDANQVWNTGYHISALPKKSENGQTGTNDCGTGSADDSLCQTVWLNDVDDFCLWAPASTGTIGDTERDEVAWCTKSGRGARTIPNGALKGVHFVKTPDYVQVTGVGDLTKINIKKGDAGGELDPHGADGNGNPVGGLVFGNSFGANRQYHEWTNFMSDSQFCFRACTGPNAAQNCQHIYDVMGCDWNMPANYDAGVFESCAGDDDLPMGVYGSSTWYQGVSPTPAAHPVASSSSCRTLPTVSVAPVNKRRAMKTVHASPTPF